MRILLNLCSVLCLAGVFAAADLAAYQPGGTSGEQSGGQSGTYLTPVRSEAQPGLAGQVAVRDLPPEAREVLALIRRGGPFPYSKDGIVFSNREHILASRPRGYYHEYTVPTPHAKNRGARRIIAGRDGEFFYTDDHYATFRRIKDQE